MSSRVWPQRSADNRRTSSGPLQAGSGASVWPVMVAVTARNADIEDLFTPSDYLRLYDAAFSTKTKVSDLPAGDRIVKRIADLRSADFDHGVPADRLLRERTDELPKLAAGTLEQFEQLFTKLNATLPPGS